MQGNLFIITAASGAGKTSLVRDLLAQDSAIQLSVSHTTRPARPGEIDGVHYHFVSDAAFVKLIETGNFLECAQVHNARYGTSQNSVNNALQQGQDVLLEIDWQGAEQVRRIYPKAISIFILPPSLEALEQRLHGRGQDSVEVINRRLAAARDEMSHVTEFDYVIINDVFDTALQDLCAIVRCQRLVVDKQLAKHQALISRLV